MSSLVHGRYRGTEGGRRPLLLRSCLEVATNYRRAAGYFASSVFTVAPKAFAEFFARGGRFWLVCCPELPGQDLEALHRALYMTQVPSATAPPLAANPGQAVKLLEWAVRTRSVAMKVALPNDASGAALYHEKFGVACGPDKAIAFLGSANETRSAYVRNFELVECFESSHSSEDREQIRSLEIAFSSLWENRTPGLEVLDLHEAFTRGVLRSAPEENRGEKPSQAMVSRLEVPRETIRRPDGVELRPYQRQAVEEWLRRSGRGILAMATGAGKTITALSAAESVVTLAGPPLFLLVIAPYLHLVDQWTRECHKFGLRPVKCSGNNPEWKKELASAIYSVNSGVSPIRSAITTNATFLSLAFSEALKQLRVRTLLVADEVHNLGAAELSRSLPSAVSLRLGLSATPERKYDVTGSQSLETYFGGVAFRFDLRDAIRSDPPVLTPYRYFPILVALEQDESEEYQRLTEAIARQMHSLEEGSLSSLALGLLLKRSRLVASARNKVPALRTLIQQYRNDSHSIVYCGDGSVEMEALSERVEGEDEGTRFVRQIEAVVRLMGYELGMNIASFTSETPLQEREQLRQEFGAGRKQALVAIRCLDEGVDFPEARRAFILASSSNPRQFIQRRGRLLRRAPGKTSAEIFDFIVIPPPSTFERGTTEWKVNQRLVRKEMERVVEFASIASNGPQARATLLPLLKELQLLDLA